MRELKKQIKEKNFLPCYLLYGNELYLRNLYEKKLKSAILSEDMDAMNYDYFEEKDCNITNILDAAQTLPFLCEKRLIVVKNSGLFKKGRKDDTDKIAEYLKELPESTCILFSENEVDKRNKLFKQVKDMGYSVDMSGLSEKELVTWIQRECKKGNLQIDKPVAVSLLRTVGTDMQNIESELEKLIVYKMGDTNISNQDIEAVCVKSLESRIFDMVGALGNKKPHEAVEVYRNLLLLKESPIMVLTMMVRQFRMIYQCKLLLNKGENIGSITQRTGLREFIVKDCIRQGKNFSEKILNDALQECLDMDVAIKSGRIDSELAVELLILKYGGNSVTVE